jgi:hypothetical protein
VAKKTVKKATLKKAAKKIAAKGKKATKKAARKSYPEALKKKVVAAIRKGMTHIEASTAFKVGVHSIPNWIRRHT